MKLTSNRIYTPLASRPRTGTGRTEAGDRRKARSLGFKSVKQLREHHDALLKLSPAAASRLFVEFVTAGEPVINPLRANRRRIKGLLGSPRQYRQFSRESYAFRDSRKAGRGADVRELFPTLYA